MNVFIVEHPYLFALLVIFTVGVIGNVVEAVFSGEGDY